MPVPKYIPSVILKLSAYSRLCLLAVKVFFLIYILILPFWTSKILVIMNSKTSNNAGKKTNSNITVSTIDVSLIDVVQKFATGIAQKVINETVTKAVKEVVQREKFPPASTRLQRMAEPSMKSYINLYNDHRSVLRPDKLLRLEQKLADMQKYSQVISDDLKVLIVDKVNGITASQGRTLQIAIMQSLEAEVNQIPNVPDRIIPKFLETSYHFKCLKVVCADVHSLNWLKQTVATLKPWNEARLEVTFMSTYSVYSTVSQKRTPKSTPNEGRIKFAIPNSSVITTAAGGPALKGGPPAVTFLDITKHLALHNTPVKVDSWKELYKDDKGAYTLYFVSMDLESIEEIRKKGNRLFYKLGTLKVAPLNQNDEIAYKKKISDERKAAAKTVVGP